MAPDALISSLKTQVLSSLEEHVYQQAVAQNLVETVLRQLVENAVGRLQLDLPVVTSVGGALLGVLGSLAPTVKSLGLDQQVMGLVRQAGIDATMRDTILRGITRYLEANGGRLMEVAVDAAVAKLTRA